MQVLWLAVGPGIMGHTGLNGVLKYFPVLFISLAVTTEPAIGTFMGWAAGLVDAPTIWTYLGGTIVLMATVIVTVAMHFREQNAATQAAFEGDEVAFPDVGYLPQADVDGECSRQARSPQRGLF